MAGTEVNIVYRIYEIREGLLKVPKEFYYGSRYGTFDDGYKTMEDACDAIKNSDTHQEFVILAMAQRSVDYF